MDFFTANLLMFTHLAAFAGGVVCAILVPWVWRAGKWIVSKFSR